MDKAIINILIFNDNLEDIQSLKAILSQPGYNIFTAYSEAEADEIIRQKRIGIILFSSEIKGVNSFSYIEKVTTAHDHDAFIIVTGNKQEKANKLLTGLNKGAVDFIVKPFVKNIVLAKISVFKRLYFKNKRISSLLENILPEGVLEEFKTHNKYTPRKHENCTILFTDFVSFSKKALNFTPSELVQILDYYFSHFDTIIKKYQLEKIKTMGDSYMAVGGLNDDTGNVEIRTALAAIEIRDFIITDNQRREKHNLDAWDIRIGIHSGELVAGVIGNYKFSFDVWGDAVNVASRCEANSDSNQINVSGAFHKSIAPYFNTIERGQIPIKNRGKINMFFIEGLKSGYTVNDMGKIVKPSFRKMANLPELDFLGIRSYILDKLKHELDDKLIYHSLKHTLNVEKAVIKYGKLEGLEEHELFLIRTAALFHDAGFIVQYNNNEKIGVDLFKAVAPSYGYSDEDIVKVERIILSTVATTKPHEICEKIMCDADLDYLGRKDYHITAQNLFLERQNYGVFMSEKEWLTIQINYLEHKHHYYTISANNVRKKGKEKRIAELKQAYCLRFGDWQ